MWLIIADREDVVLVFICGLAYDVSVWGKVAGVVVLFCCFAFARVFFKDLIAVMILWLCWRQGHKDGQ